MTPLKAWCFIAGNDDAWMSKKGTKMLPDNNNTNFGKSRGWKSRICKNNCICIALGNVSNDGSLIYRVPYRVVGSEMNWQTRNVWQRVLIKSWCIKRWNPSAHDRHCWLLQLQYQAISLRIIPPTHYKIIVLLLHFCIPWTRKCLIFVSALLLWACMCYVIYASLYGEMDHLKILHSDWSVI